jgi:hypothetical protein
VANISLKDSQSLTIMQISKHQAATFGRTDAVPTGTGPAMNRGLELNQDQSQCLGKILLVEKMDAQFSRNVPEFSMLAKDDRDLFLVTSMKAAEARGLITEQGVASYALAAWWLGVGFEEKSTRLVPLFESAYPEVRKVYAMNEWVHAMIGDPNNVTSADEHLKQAFFKTRNWGA